MRQIGDTTLAANRYSVPLFQGSDGGSLPVVSGAEAFRLLVFRQHTGQVLAGV